MNLTIHCDFGRDPFLVYLTRSNCTNLGGYDVLSGTRERNAEHARVHDFHPMRCKKVFLTQRLKLDNETKIDKWHTWTVVGVPSKSKE